MYSKWGTGHPLNNEEKTKHWIAAVQESPRQAGTEQGRHPVQRMRWQCEDVVKDSKRHRHKEIELRLLRTVTPAFPNSPLLGFANLVLVGFKGGCIFVHIYGAYTEYKKESTYTARLRQGYSNEAGVWKESYRFLERRKKWDSTRQ